MVACSEGPVDPAARPVAEASSASLARGPLTPATAGAYHNAFLDFSFPRVRAALASGGRHQAACRAIAQAMRDFVVEYRVKADPRGIGEEIAGARCTSASGRRPQPGGSFTLAGDGTTSAEFNAVAEEMAYAVEAGYSAADLSALFNQKVAYARANFPTEEADVIEAAASVGLSSIDYWNANYETQSAQLRAEMDAQTYARLPAGARMLAPPDDVRLWRAAAARVGVADLKGAIHGGISGARGGWSGVLAGAVIEGGGKSAGALLAELIK
jgi:hypothetical protein